MANFQEIEEDDPVLLCACYASSAHALFRRPLTNMKAACKNFFSKNRTQEV
jgi:hypothetical protein